MGKVATDLSDAVYVTNDNPRGEDPNDIAEQITAGLDEDNYIKILDRRKAILEAIESSQNSVILLAGKGAERVTKTTIDNQLISIPNTSDVELLKSVCEVRKAGICS